MRNKINILPENLASKIAAGEVIQRPASVVKELLENSIDAGATKITLIIKDAGKKLIQIVDNGCGMSEDDAVIAFQRHSTSKIQTLEDLEQITTLGFRGEALASIAAVSQVDMITKTEEDEIATKVSVEGIVIKEVTKTSFEKGTSISVKNLFFNTPARREFLKSNNVEFKHIFDVFVRIALSYSELEMKFISDGETVLDLRPQQLDERIVDIFGKNLQEALMLIENDPEGYERIGLSVSGYISKPDFSKKSRSEQFLFLNRRYIINRSLNHAVFQAYENMLEKNNYPFFILFIKIDPRRVDVNVHPSKLEVKFKDERNIYHLINSSVRKTLSENNLIPSVKFESLNDNIKIKFQQIFKKVPEFSSNKNVELDKIFVDGKSTDIQVDLIEKIKPIFSEEGNITEDEADKSNISLSGFSFTPPVCYQLHNQFIIVPIEEGMMIIDQHAAHERILFEKALVSFSIKNNVSQQLLFPHTIEFSAGDFAIIQILQDDLKKLGFEIKIFGRNTVVLEGVPVDIKPGNELTILQEIVDLYKENEYEQKLEPRENLAKSFACKSAIKFGDTLNQTEMRSLIEQLFMTRVPYVCPHGRPVIIKISLEELARRFGRP
ncbi:MAG: DNA mismatch repair protein MutL [Ignavibacteriae bacterium]|nr:MAG: DNA mismatch repair protein MutL [Ignavibacteriota bacterium]